VTVAALYVETGGVYYGLPDVDPWDEARDARLYAGPWPVVAHPPCNRYSKLAAFRRQRDGMDSGCFAHALECVRRFGGVLEHPAYSLAWEIYELPRPLDSGWVAHLGRPGWSCLVDQRRYGGEMRKPTWLYFVGDEPPTIEWGRGAASDKSVWRSYGGGPRQKLRSRTPIAFRDVLLDMARSAGRVPA
jgi:hypothetical protein